MFATSKDILFLTISVCVVVFTFFFCWGMYYMISAIRNIFKVTDEVKGILKKVEETIEMVKSKISESASYVFLLGETLKKVVDIAKGFSERKREKKEKEDEAGEPEEEIEEKIVKTKNRKK